MSAAKLRGGLPLLTFTATVLLAQVAAAQVADLAITKTDGAASDIPGTSITYTIVASNPVGPNAALGAAVTDNFPAGLNGITWTCVAAGGATCAAAGAGNIGDTVDLPVGGTVTYTVNATIAANATGMLSNTATVAAPGGTLDPNMGNNSATDTNALTPRADLSISKTDSVDPVIAGNNLTYTVTVTNNGPSNATGVTLTDNLPGEVNFVSSLPGNPVCVHAAGVVSCSLGTLVPAGNFVITIIVAVPSSVADGLTISNVAVASSATIDPGPNPNNVNQDTQVEREPDLAIVKSSPNPVIAGTSFSYSITAENNGVSDASSVSISDTLPNEVSFVSAPGCVHDGAPMGGIVTCNIGNFPAGDSENFSITVAVEPCTPIGTMMMNQVDILHDPAESDPGPSVNSFALATEVDTQADLVITKSDTPDPTIAGEEVTYAIGITNNGPSCAVNVMATDTMPPDVLFREGKSDISCIGDVIVLCAQGTMTPGQVNNLIITGKVECSAADGSIQTNSITASSTTADPNNGNNTAETSTTVDTLSDITVVKTDAPDPVQPASLLTYNFDVSNAGPSDANEVVLVDTLPAGVTYVSGSEGCSAAGNIVTCQVPVVACGKVERPRIRVRVETTNSPLINEVTVATSTTETTTDNNSSSASTTVRNTPRFLLRMSGAPRFLREGGVTTAIYLLRVQNKTLLDVTSARVVNTLPAGMTLADAVPAPTAINGNELSWDLAPLVPAGTQIILIKAQLAPGTAPGTVLINTANLIENNVTVATASFTGGVREPQTDGAGELGVGLTAIRRVLPGSKMTSTLDLDNAGRLEAQDIVLQLTVPAALVLESALPQPNTTEINGDQAVLTWNIDSLRGPGKKRVKVTHVVPNNLAGSSFGMSATVSDAAGRSGADAASVEVRQ